MMGPTLGHFQIIRQLGRGGQGEAYLALDTQLNRPVVIKVLPADLIGNGQARERFLSEARLASQLNHPNICSVYEVDEVDDRLFIVMPFIEGRTLKEVIGGRPLPLETVLAIALQLADALCDAHERGILHRDIKSSNILLTEKGRAVLLDFGLAMRQPAQPETPELESQKRRPFGTPSYMSPEHVAGLVTDARSDIFSFGVVLYEMVTGQRPFTGKTTAEIMEAIVHDEPVPARTLRPDLDPTLETIIHRALAKDPAERYQSVEEMRRDLSELATRMGLGDASGVRALLFEVARRERRSKRLLVLSAVSLATIVLVSGGLLLFPRLFPKKESAIAPAPRSRTAAILPFRNLKDDPASDYIGYALADGLINNLAYVRHLIVRPTAAVEKYRHQPIDIQRVSRELKVDTIVSGTFIKEGSEVRIHAQLIDVPSNAVLWSDMIQVRSENLLSLQDLITKQIVRELQLHLTQEEQERLRRDTPRNAQGYESFIRSRGLGLRTEESERAIALLEKSVALDPGYAPAWVELGWRYRQRSLFGLGNRSYYEKAEAAGRRALELNPDSLGAMVLLAYLYTDEGRIEEAVTLLDRARQISPNSPDPYEGLRYAYRYAGLLEESLAASETAQRLDPTFYERPINYVNHALLYLGRYREFIEAIPERDAPLCYFYRGFALFHLGDTAGALTQLNRAIRSDPGNVFSYLAAALKARMENRPDRGLRILRFLERRRESRGIPDGEMSYKIAQLYAQLGDVSSAVRMLERAIAQGFVSYPYIARDPLLDPLRSHPRYARALDIARRRHEQIKAAFVPPAISPRAK